MCVIVERARRRRLARAQQLATAEEDQWQAMEQVWLILQLFMSEDESVQAGEKAKNVGPEPCGKDTPRCWIVGSGLEEVHPRSRRKSGSQATAGSRFRGGDITFLRTTASLYIELI